MGIHTSIYRERYIIRDDAKHYKIKLFKDNKEVPLRNAVSLREEFYFGKSTWQINEWFLQRILKRYDGEIDEGLSYENIYNEYIYLDDLKDLLKDVKKVLKNHELAEKVLPMPKDLKLVKPKEETFDAKKNVYVVQNPDDWAEVPRAEMYSECYFETLKWAEELLGTLIDEENQDLIDEYIVDIG